MKKRTRRILLLVIIVSVVSPISLIWTAIISVTALEALILDYNDFCLERR
ncbi:hypothetical protein [Tetragenococcus halophilus]|nr:hypothetical protein [Tetragenococcus halophilus]NWN99292.1 hypothetical protein [Tetragenococcus halophilus]